MGQSTVGTTWISGSDVAALCGAGANEVELDYWAGVSSTLMYELSDGFVALPGGLGTLEELFEITTWSQLGLHAKPTGLLDVEGFYSPLVGFLDRLVTEGFVNQRHRALLRVAHDPVTLLERLAAFPD